MQGACRRRKKERSNTEHIELISRNRSAASTTPRSFEYQLYITMARVAHRSANLCTGVISCFVSRLDCISQLCAIYSFTGMLFTAYAGCMIKYQPLFILGIDKDNQELTKESAFGAMGMFVFLFSLSVIYLCLHKNRNEDLAIRSQGYMRPQLQGGGGMSRDQMFVELPVAQNSLDDLDFESSYRDNPTPSASDSFDEDGDESEIVPAARARPVDLLS